MALWPIVVVDFNHRAIRLRLGVIRDELGPGVYWRWWFIEQVMKVSATEEFLDLPFGDVPTKDGLSVSFSANIGYRIYSPRELWSSVSDPDEGLPRLALGKLATLIARKDWAELASGQPQLRNWMRKQLMSETKGWGLEITRVFVTNLVCTRPIRILADAPTSVVVDQEAA